MPQPSEPRWQHSVRVFFTVLFHELPALVVVNLLFLLSCLPVVTFGPARSALDRVADDLLHARCSHAARTYWAYFKERLSASLLWGLVFLALLGILGFAFLSYSVLFTRNLIFLPLGMVALLGLLTLIGVGLHFFPALTASDAPAKDQLRAAARTALIRVPGTLAATLLSLAVLVAIFLTFPLSLPILLCLGASIPALLGALARDPSGDEEN